MNHDPFLWFFPQIFKGSIFPKKILWLWSQVIFFSSVSKFESFFAEGRVFENCMYYWITSILFENKENKNRRKTQLQFARISIQNSFFSFKFKIKEGGFGPQTFKTLQSSMLWTVYTILIEHKRFWFSKRFRAEIECLEIFSNFETSFGYTA